LVDGGTFNWANGKFPELSTPDESYHGVVYTEQFGAAAYITKARTQLLRDMGSTMSPMSAFILNLGLESLSCRMDRHCSNALAVAEFLSKHDKVDWVDYPALPGNSQFELTKKYLPRGACGVISVGIKGGREAATRFLNNLKLLNIVVHVADARSCALHPASTTHRQLTDEQLNACGVRPEQVRLSIGIEDIDDILADLEQALNA
jgi:O-acetylhomoserine (thiol)-lyase